METKDYHMDHEQTDQMYLSKEAVCALDLTESKRALYRTGKSLYSVLNRCKTNGGKMLLISWLEAPLVDIDKINDSLRDGIGECLAKMPDLKKLTAKLAKKCTLLDCCKIYQGFFIIKSLIDTLDLKQIEKINEEFLVKLKMMHGQCRNFVNLIEETVDKESLDNGDPLIDARQDESLAGLAMQMDSVKRKAEKAFSIIANELGLQEAKTIKFENCPQNGFSARITLKYEDLIRGNQKYKVIGTKKDGVRFTTVDLLKHNDQYVELRHEYEEVQSTIFDKMLETLRTYQKPLESLNDVLSNLDVYYALADCAKYGSQVYVRPKLLPKGTGKIKLNNLRHPCLENQMNVYYIPNSIDFDKNNKKFFIVTGPNMGGKSTFLRSVGIAIVLAQIGSFVPADEAEISIVNSIFTRIGASDKQFKGISTFKAEMLETADILKHATEDSLVIIDELGRGTSTFDGFGLAYGISKEIALNIKAYCLFATHFHELTHLSKEIPLVDNLFVSYNFDEQAQNLKMLYQVQRGVCDQKFGIHVAKMVQFPDEMIEFAQEKAARIQSAENPTNKEQLEKVSELIKTKSTELQEIDDDALLSYLNELTKEAQ